MTEPWPPPPLRQNPGHHHDDVNDNAPVLLQSDEDLLGVGIDELGPGLPERVDDVVDEAHLRLLDGGIVPVAHRGDVDSRFPLLRE